MPLVILVREKARVSLSLCLEFFASNRFRSLRSLKLADRFHRFLQRRRMAKRMLFLLSLNRHGENVICVICVIAISGYNGMRYESGAKVF